jgi:glutamine synthetase
MLRIRPRPCEDRTVDGSCSLSRGCSDLAVWHRRDRERDRSGRAELENLYAIPHDELRARGLETLPTNLLNATIELEADDVMRAALGRGRNEDYVDYFIRVKRDEWNRYHEQVTPWEIREYLTRF